MDSTAQSIIITGAGSGIGRACAQLFLEKGYNVGLIGRRAALLEDVAKGHSNALPLACDITDADQVAKAFETARSTWGRIDILFNNAGMSKPSRTIDETPVEDWLEVVQVNLTGSFLCARAAFAIMRAQSPQGGRIINNGSVSAYTPRPGSIPYTATKHACGQIDIGNALTEMAKPMTIGVPQADGSIKAEATMDVAHVATSLLHMAQLPLEANVQFMTVMATKMPYVGRG